MLDLVVVGTGAISPVGLNAAATCAALRAGIVRIFMLDDYVSRNGQTLVAARVPSLNRCSSIHHLADMALRALSEAISAIDQTRRSTLVFHLALLLQDRNAVPAELIEHIRTGLKSLSITQVNVSIYLQGHAAGFSALREAQLRMLKSPDEITALLGLDTLSDLPSLDYLDRRHRLKEDGNPRGLIPGEAAACVLVTSSRTAAYLGLPAQAIIASVGIGQEPATIDKPHIPLLAEGLTSALKEALDGAHWTHDSVRCVYSDQNGEAYRAKEWIFALTRTLHDADLIHPADCIGDSGAASAPLLITMATAAWARGYAKGPRALVYCSSDSGLRGAACLRVA